MKRLIQLILVTVLIVGGMPAVADQTSPRLDKLFAELQSVLDPRKASSIERQIWKIWGFPDNTKASGPLAQGVIQMTSGQYAQARANFDRVIEIAPEFAEGWNKRATVAFLQGDYEASVRDIQKTVELEPRHFGALSGLAMIYENIGLEEQALDVLVRVKEIYPGMIGLDDRMSALRETLAQKKT